MANIWRKDDNVKEQPKRNIMDLSFQNNLTTQFGKLVPVFCKEFIPGDSFSIKPTFSLKFQPMVFPIQTRMRAHLHFFKVRNRNLWKDWEDFIAKNKENLDPPYLDTSVTKPSTGSLLDYFGVPTTIVGNYGNETLGSSLHVGDVEASSAYRSDTLLAANQRTVADRTHAMLTARDFVQASLGTEGIAQIHTFPSYQVTEDCNGIQFNVGLKSSVTQFLEIDAMMYNYPDATFPTNPPSNYSVPTPRNENTFLSCIYMAISDSPFTNSYQSYTILPVSWYQNGVIKFLTSENLNGKYVTLLNCTRFARWTGSQDAENLRLPSYYMKLVSVYTLQSLSGVHDIDDTNSPYWRSGATTDLRERIKLSALPCRAYEQIYNSFYRNAENNPYILNGVPEYNKYMPTDEGGVDTNLYDFHYRNWEDDFLTTALQQPQAGIAPLVGLTGTAGTATVTLADEDGNTSEGVASYDEEGNVTSVSFANNTSLTEALADAVTYGISINDIRNVNAFQRWLEAKARGGYKYRDVIETMFGISVRYDTLDMPEFIGGTSIDIMVNQISQTVPTETSPLGDYAGQASGIGTGQTINEYFDEHGFIIGILSVVPVPNYSQLLPKHLIKRDAFDYYFPQFGHIGMQPIKYDEVCPIQAYQDSSDQNNVLNETFGYQRAWYDYLASTDEVHGEFRTNLRNFVMNRTFDVKPELVKEFLTVDPSQLNDVFAIQDDSYDKILGQIYFDVKAKRPIPLYGIPKIE